MPVEIRAAAQITSRLSHDLRKMATPTLVNTTQAAAAVTTRYPAPCTNVAITAVAAFAEAAPEG